jgi:hypothetical protein
MTDDFIHVVFTEDVCGDSRARLVALIAEQGGGEGSPFSTGTVIVIPSGEKLTARRAIEAATRRWLVEEGIPKASLRYTDEAGALISDPVYGNLVGRRRVIIKIPVELDTKANREAFGEAVRAAEGERVEWESLSDGDTIRTGRCVLPEKDEGDAKKLAGRLLALVYGEEAATGWIVGAPPVE